jgi:hypothetical protein
LPAIDALTIFPDRKKHFACMLRIHTRGKKTLPLNATHYSTQQDDDRESVNWTQQDDDIESVNSPI